MTEALVVNADDNCSTFPSDNLLDALDEPYVNEKIQRLCGSLIELWGSKEDKLAKTWTIHFVHFLVKEYLSRTTNINLPMLKRICLSHAASENDLLAWVCL
jgi:hypothetical protein